MTVRQVKPDVLLGLSAVGGLFSKEICHTFASTFIFYDSSISPDSFRSSERFNCYQTSNFCYCTPEEAFSIVGDNVIFGSGSPFSNVEISREGASEADLNILPKYKFQTSKDEHRVDLAAGAMVPNETSSGYMSSERTLSPDDAEDCDGICGHVFGAFDCEVEALGLFCGAQ
ncbi:hypothetical protein OROHE_006838 [Orobanche hederae]